MCWLPVETGPQPRVSSLSVQTQDWGGWRKEEIKEAGPRSGAVFPGDAELGLCRSHVSIRAEAAAEAKATVYAQAPKCSCVTVWENGSPLKENVRLESV